MDPCSFNDIQPPSETYVSWNDGNAYRATSDSFPNYKHKALGVVIQSALDELEGQ